MNNHKNLKTIVVIDKEEAFCASLSKVFVPGSFVVLRAQTAEKALELIEKSRPLVIFSDTDILESYGFSILEKIYSGYPSVSHILMSSGDIDCYIPLIRKYNISNIIKKDSDITAFKTDTYIRSLAEGVIFGLEKYFDKCAIKKEHIIDYYQARSVCSAISGHYPGKGALFLEIAVDELISNALFHGVLQLTGIPRERWCREYRLNSNDAIAVRWAVDDTKIGVSVEDPRGILSKRQALYWMDRTSKLSCEKDEEHGRGLHLVRTLVDRFIINIDSGKRTECLILHYLSRSGESREKPVLINQLGNCLPNQVNIT
ncbi:ATP-binding protein [Chitinispirillales bacterium ANBcel5]|uniref:ATP-binding protein n=1 Tax=Cellulosispirillum alkaliphilum TaxID=3039283 RepID=UPI002A57D048|nr:ATP-binding protein [Chitinispirillales bacterium ANBcel5]